MSIAKLLPAGVSSLLLSSTHSALAATFSNLAGESFSAQTPSTRLSIGRLQRRHARLDRPAALAFVRRCQRRDHDHLPLQGRHSGKNPV